MDSIEPIETRPSIDQGPLPTPTLATADDIVAAMSDPDQAPQVVVSMLQLMGVGLYQPDGTPIRRGTATKATDFYAFEPEARGLVAMLRSRNDPNDQLSFRDFHAALAKFGFTGSAEQLATAYQDAYAADPTAFVSEMVNALGGIAVDGTISSFEEWLLLVDGFVPPNEAATAMAYAGAWPGPVAAGRGTWGLSRSNVSQFWDPQSQADFATFAARLLAIANAATIEVATSPMTIHEGHNNNHGSPMVAKAHVVVGALQFVSPMSGQAVLSANPNASGLNIGFDGDASANNHGTLLGTVAPTDAGGTAEMTYSPRVELADGAGVSREEAAHINAFFYRSDLILALYGSGTKDWLPLIVGATEDFAIFHAGWHEKTEGAVTILWTDTYNGIDDTITFVGTLDHVDPGANGMPNYWGIGIATGTRAGWAACNPGFDGPTSGTGQAIFNAYPTRNGYIEIAAYVTAGDALAGISTEPVEVKLEDGVTFIPVIAAPPPGDNGGANCPHGSFGQVELSGLTLPPAP